MEAQAPYLPLIRTSVTLYDAFKFVDVRVWMDKRENYAMEDVYVVFPFAVDNPQFLLDTANAVYQACEEQLPNTCRDWYSIQHAVGITDSEAGVLWATRQAPLVQIGEIRTGTWDADYLPTKGHLYAWIMNNLYSTNFKAAQGGQMSFDFRIGTVASGLDKRAVREWGERFALPPVALVENVQPDSYKWLDVQPSNFSAQVVKSLLDGSDGIVMRLKETAGQATTATVSWLGGGQIELHQTDLFETAEGEIVEGNGKTFGLEVKAHGVVTVKMKIGGR
jgi:hypothetical protein